MRAVAPRTAPNVCRRLSRGVPPGRLGFSVMAGERFEQTLPSRFPCQSTFNVRRRNELPMTLTDDKAIAAAATTGDSSKPKNG